MDRERTDRDLSKIRLVLMLFRNLLGIKDLSSKIANSTEKEWKTTLQERLIVCLEQEKIIPLFLSLAGSATDRPYQDWNMITLEIFYNFFIDRDVDDILSDKVMLCWYRNWTYAHGPRSDATGCQENQVDGWTQEGIQKNDDETPALRRNYHVGSSGIFLLRLLIAVNLTH